MRMDAGEHEILGDYGADMCSFTTGIVMKHVALLLTVSLPMKPFGLATTAITVPVLDDASISLILFQLEG